MSNELSKKAKFATNEVFNFTVYAQLSDGVGYVFETETVVENTFIMSDGNGFSELHIEDALLDEEFLSLALSGAFEGIDMRIEGDTIVRDADTCMDYRAELSIDVARLKLYKIGGRAGDIVNPILVFRFYHKTPKGEKNMNYQIIR